MKTRVLSKGEMQVILKLRKKREKAIAQALGITNTTI